MFLTVVQTVDAIVGKPEGRNVAGHKKCDTCWREKAIMVLIGGEEMSVLFKQVEEVTDLGPRVGFLFKNFKSLNSSFLAYDI